MATTRRSIVSAAAITAVIGPGSAGAADPAVVDLTSTRLDRSVKDFTFARTGGGAEGAWAVRDDPSVPSGRVLVQTSEDPTDYRFPLAIHQRILVADVDVTVRFKTVSGQVDRAGGLVVRLKDPDNYYVVRANALEDNVNLYHVVKGRRQEIHGAPVRVTSDQWHALGLRVERDRFTVSFDGKVLFTATDQTFNQAGSIGLWTKADSVTAFDALTVSALP
jgi:hypothetical protein